MEESAIEKLPRRVYTTEFRQQAVEMITRDGLGLAEAARRLSISPKTLTNWVKRVQGGDSPGGATPRREVTEAEAELSRLRRENAELRLQVAAQAAHHRTGRLTAPHACSENLRQTTSA